MMEEKGTSREYISYKEANIQEGMDTSDSSSSPFIRIKTQGDAIFEQEQDDEMGYNYDYDFISHWMFPQEGYREQVLSPSLSSRRKQKLNARTLFSEDGLVNQDEEDEEEWQEGREKLTPTYTVNPKLWKDGQQRRNQIPMYLLNPADYNDDQAPRIRRAIVTYRFHQQRKDHILALTEENMKLRKHLAKVTALATKLSGCECNKNQAVDLSLLDKLIPVVQRMTYVKGKREVLAAPYSGSRTTEPAIPVVTMELQQVQEKKSEATLDLGLQKSNLNASLDTKPYMLANENSTKDNPNRNEGYLLSQMHQVQIPTHKPELPIRKGWISLPRPLQNSTKVSPSLPSANSRVVLVPNYVRSPSPLFTKGSLTTASTTTPSPTLTASHLVLSRRKNILPLGSTGQVKNAVFSSLPKLQQLQHIKDYLTPSTKSPPVCTTAPLTADNLWTRMEQEEDEEYEDVAAALFDSIINETPPQKVKKPRKQTIQERCNEQNLDSAMTNKQCSSGIPEKMRKMGEGCKNNFLGKYEDIIILDVDDQQQETKMR